MCFIDAPRSILNPGEDDIRRDKQLLVSPRQGCTKCSNWDLPKKEGMLYWRIMQEIERNVKKSDPPCLGVAVHDALSQYCLRVNVSDCPNEDCKFRKEKLLRSAPASDWYQFREWITTFVSCYEPWNIRDRAAEGLLCMCSRLFVNIVEQLQHLEYSDMCIDLQRLSDLFLWTTRVLYDADLGLRTQKPLAQSRRIFLPESFQVIQAAQRENVCPNRLWNIFGISPRGHMDASSFLEILQQRNAPVDSKKHNLCTEQYCIFTDDNSSVIQQLHKCNGEQIKEHEKVFPLDLIDETFQNASSDAVQTAWQIEKEGGKQVLLKGGDYIAISHVWSDGTGSGLKSPGHLNSCLFDYFARIAKKLGCNGIWWDVICLPTGREARSKALNRMLKNYEQAKYTVVHDSQLIDMEWREDGTPAAALVLSTWFTRGWTAAELFSSKNIKVLFKDPENPRGDPLIKDLYEDVFAHEPTSAWPPQRDQKYPCLGHFIASDIIRRCRTGRVYSRHPAAEPQFSRRVSTFEDLMAILRPRSTSWPRDRMTVAGLMATETFDSTNTGQEATKAILKSFGRIRAFHLYHAETPICNSGPWSWCPPSLFDLGQPLIPLEDHISYGGPRISEDGVITSIFVARIMRSKDVSLVTPYSSHPALSARIISTLCRWENCLLLQCTRTPCSLYLLALTVGAAETGVVCRYVGCVSFVPNDTPQELVVGGCDCSLGEDMKGEDILPEKNATAMVDLWLDLAGFPCRGEGAEARAEFPGSGDRLGG